MQTLESPTTLAGRSPSLARRSRPDRSWGARPRHRPPVGLRVVVGVLGVLTMISTVALMLSDRAPRALSDLFGDAAERLSARIDASARLPSTEGLPESDFLVHVGLWALVALLVGWTVWSWRGLLLGSLAVLAGSMLVEAAQDSYSDTRAVEASDVAGNAVGVGVGAAAVAVCYALWSAGAWLVQRYRTGT